MDVIMLWIVAVFFSGGALYFITLLTMMAFKRRFPYEDVVVEKVSLAEWKIPKSHQIYLSVRYTTSESDDHLKLSFFGANRSRIERSRRYLKLVEFYAVGRSFRLYHLPFGVGIVPECPVIRVETVMAIAGTFAFVFASIGAFIALSY